ncbi:hypothetical protein FPZ24_09865 [Sphingomonas panacisoli]|uniref:PepSY domain-containing protein n=1 Tax=Sphingomonas panacisoli TaxID=1813879 RepID=A0A5B8LIL0_9SPHN|nr:hypothetical protein [Sphingomonas panacisoli]QDZ07756.1 hypothetical protein FPZ24_09865 [Sphingomonas panacisoli]
MLTLLLLASLAVTADQAQDQTPTPAPTATPAPAIVGESRETAYKVKSVAEEYAIMRKLGLRVDMQSLVEEKGHPYDVLEGVDPNTGAKHTVWFDIKSFYGKEFGF